MDLNIVTDETAPMRPHILYYETGVFKVGAAKSIDTSASSLEGETLILISLACCHTPHSSLPDAQSQAELPPDSSDSYARGRREKRKKKEMKPSFSRHEQLAEPEQSQSQGLCCFDGPE